MQTETFDVVVVGAGSGGENLAASLADAGRSVAIVEEHLVGGECPFLACMPSKAMVRSAQVRSLLFRVQELGAMGDALRPVVPEKGWARAVARRDDIISHGDDHEHAQDLLDAGVTLIRGRGRITGEGVVEVLAGEVRRRLEAADVVLATGSRPVVPPIEGIGDVPTWTSDEAWTATDRPQSVIVLGGGPVGCELAQVFARFAVDVTIVEQADALVGSEEPAVSDALAGILRDERIEVALGVEAQRAERVDDGVRVHLDDGSTRTAERLVLAVGRTPRTTGIGLEDLGIDVDAPLGVDDQGRVVGHDHLWAVGDVTAVAPFTHMANHQARVATDALLGGDATVRTHAVPRAVYTDPPVFGVGLTQARARAEGLTVEVVEMDLASTARHATDGGPGGHLVLVADADRRVLVGASAVGAGAPEWMTQLVLGIHAALPVATLAEVIQPFPAHAEALQSLLAELRDRLG